jgi:predicted membrane-bound spermidine synthase
MAKTRDNGWLVLSLFFGSGATALVYEVVWSKYLSQMFGSTIYAQTVVLAVFMGGLALGNRLFGGKSATMRQPLRAYGYVEMAIGLYAFFFPFLYEMADAVFVSLGGRLLDHGWLLLALKATLSVGLLLTPTVLMGGTLPMLVAWLQKSSIEAGRRSARFYSVNSLGAVCGAGVAGFYLVQNWGMVAALQAAALFNLVVAGIAIALGREEIESPASDLAAPDHQKTAVPLRWAGVLVFITGAISMGLEVLASRSLALIFGSSLQSFAIVLMAFILGIGLGSAVIASPRLRHWNSEKTVVWLLLGAASWIGLLVFNIEAWVDFYRYARSGLAPSTVGYLYYQGLTALLAVIVLGLPAAMIGAVLPLLIRSLASSATSLGTEVGRLLTRNTLGAVVGVLATGFVLMPQLGLRGAFGVLALCLGIVAVVTAWRQQMRGFAMGAAAVLIALSVLFPMSGEGWRYTLSSGIFRLRETEVDKRVMATRKERVKILFYEDAADATVSVEQSGDSVGLRVNGKPDATSDGDMSTQLLCAHLPMLARPDSKDVFILGMGSGVTGGATLGHPVERVTIAENCEPVVRATKFFEPWNRGVLNDPRTDLRIEDARTLLKLSPRKYDIIISEPSNPWVVGVGSVFSQEYYQMAASRLKEGGVIAQWFHIYEMSDQLVTMVLRTFNSVFPNMEIWDASGGDLILLGSQKPWPGSPAHWAKCFERETPRKDLAGIGITSAPMLLARQMASQRTAFAIAGDGPVQRDQFPVLEYAAPRAFYLGIGSKALLRFDERTVQEEMASLEARKVLPMLTDTQLEALFGKFVSVNSDIGQYVRWRRQAGLTPEEDVEPEGLRSLPCLFRPADQKPASAPINPNLNDEEKSVEIAFGLLGGDRSRQLEGLDQMESLLRNRQPDARWIAAACAAKASKVSLLHGQANRSKTFLALGLQSDPRDMQLLYLARIVEREHPTGARLSSTQ